MLQVSSEKAEKEDRLALRIAALPVHVASCLTVRTVR